MGDAPPTPPGWYDDGNGALRYWDGGAWTSHVGPPPPPPPPGSAVGPAAASPLAAQPGLFWATAIFAALVIVGGFGPWATALGAINVSGTRGGDGWIVIVAGALALVMLSSTARSRRPAGGWVAAVLGLVGAIVGVADLGDINDRAQSTTLFGDRVIDPGWGIYLVIAASAALCIAGIALGVTRRSAWRRP